MGVNEFEKALDSKGSFRLNPDIDSKKLVTKIDPNTLEVKEGTLPAEKEKPKPKPRVRKTEQQQILEELKNIRRLLAIPMIFGPFNADEKTMKFLERMNK